MNINEIWDSNNENIWNQALSSSLKDSGRDNYIETRMSSLNIEFIRNLKVNDFYQFLYDNYFVWKYTAKNRLATTRKSLQTYKINNDMNKLEKIQEKLFNFDLNDIELGLIYASRIKGLGIAGASGLLGLLYPSYFGTVDDMVIRALLNTEEYQEDLTIKSMNPKSIKLEEAVYLIEIYRKKSKLLNESFALYNWKPRDIDVILWYYRDNQ